MNAKRAGQQLIEGSKNDKNARQQVCDDLSKREDATGVRGVVQVKKKTDVNIPDGAQILSNSGISKSVAIVHVDRALARNRGNGSSIGTVAGGDRPINGIGEQIDNAAGYKAIIVNEEGQEHVSTKALECADATVCKAVNMENSAAGVARAGHSGVGAHSKSNTALKTTVDHVVALVEPLEKSAAAGTTPVDVSTAVLVPAEIVSTPTDVEKDSKEAG